MPDQDSPPSPPLFIRPSYLRNSRHVERLETQHTVELAEFDQLRRHPQSASSSQDLSANIGSATIHRSRKDLIQDYIARNPLRTNAPKKLPTCWSDIDKWPGLELLAGATEVKFTGSTKTSDEAAAIRSDHPMPKEVGIYYFEVTVLSRGKEGLIGIGFSGPKASLNRLPGWEPESWAYHGDDGFSFSCTASGKPYGPKFAAWDVVGCGVNFETGSAFFTKNGVFLGEAFHNVRGDKLYPSVGMKKNNEHLRVNFGSAPFVFDIDSMMEAIQKQRNRVKADINKTSADTLESARDETMLVQELVAQYLAHDGYVETARAFNREVRDERKPLHMDSDGVELFDPSQDLHATKRQSIRSAILEGEIDKALNFINTYYPHVLEREENRDVYFKLRCRKFIEMICRVNDLSTQDPPPLAPKAAGKLPHPSNGTTFDHQMELDDQLHRESRAPIIPPMPVPSPFNPGLRFGDGANGADGKHDTMDTAPDGVQLVSSATDSEQLLVDALEFGQELKAEFSDDPRPAVRKALDDTFALIAYQDARESIVGGLMEGKGRVEIAEEVNSAILVSLGKPSSAALEKVVAQAEVLVDMLSSDGGAGTFVNVRRDCLQ
ncbi:SPRY-domain-containing protein [Aureobasidium namibiae CBS 147.97]|uniref:SPRY-domain-containing protein n=1 Tax=Aureobasidium namibiae CBS 147.97 TaxID=1043004 RepID=A0A074WSC8_9PEZI|nr:SPRY-domain-containing protein [Aureobasidium namibiae CBS 147.97]KEQ76075.1 SPRY-domain-containing protein [Aureobasidium namibiae CBS 147.97]